MVDIGEANRVFGEDGPVVCGNFDPVAVLLQGDPRQVYDAARRCLQYGGKRVISTAGCEVPAGTPPENLRAQDRALREFYP
jgi:uroporphyrinogen-III decarboxylase